MFSKFVLASFTPNRQHDLIRHPNRAARSLRRNHGPYQEDSMNKMTKTLVSILLIFVAPLALACDYPTRADVPDGATATKEEMIAGQRGVKAYMSAMEDYLSCIEATEQETVAGPDELNEEAKQQRIDMLNKKYNAAVEEMNIVAEEFNIQVRAYKERSN